MADFGSQGHRGASSGGMAPRHASSGGMAPRHSKMAGLNGLDIIRNCFMNMNMDRNYQLTTQIKVTNISQVFQTQRARHRPHARPHVSFRLPVRSPTGEDGVTWLTSMIGSRMCSVKPNVGKGHSARDDLLH
jgi:hypothetical protein